MRRRCISPSAPPTRARAAAPAAQGHHGADGEACDPAAGASGNAGTVLADGAGIASFVAVVVGAEAADGAAAASGVGESAGLGADAAGATASVCAVRGRGVGRTAGVGEGRTMVGAALALALGCGVATVGGGAPSSTGPAARGAGEGLEGGN
ncbi:hypothetical protein [Novosphingobium olei]|uniref:hypothetical protein n=1 Tax=Novosphingobium olei TaxID=2728851 RepID=UPI0019825BA4|nr:hypothetical protein [Novosphingobium olei]